MQSDTFYLFLALPILAFIALSEGVIRSFILKRRYAWVEARTSFLIACLQSVVRLLSGGLTLAWFFWLWHLTPLRIPVDSLAGVLLLFLTVEFVYYWHHRLSHRIRWFWATHCVHHSAEHLTFFAALRLGWTGEISGAGLLFSPAILIGFHPLAVVAMLGVNLIYQFFVHNEYVGKLGWLEAVFNTPSHHRVHHASNAAYLDRNYGGILIVYDRLFGTFIAEDEADPPRYGLVKPLRSENPLRITTHEWAAMLRDWAGARGWRNRFRTLFGPPA
jgi:sterol desaturase/sphingolipid hydroxylase (fatty acid hydroxylase superfamily)